MLTIVIAAAMVVALAFLVVGFRSRTTEIPQEETPKDWALQAEIAERGAEQLPPAPAKPNIETQP